MISPPGLAATAIDFVDSREPCVLTGLAELLGLVVTKAKPSLHAAYQSRREALGVSVAALYEKIARTELPITRELVRRTAQRMLAVCEALEPHRAPLLAGYRTLILDGSHLAATQHRLKPTRGVNGGPLPGQGLVVLDADRGLINDFLPCADGHAQERSQMAQWSDLLAPGQLWIADRNFCTKLLIFECHLRKAFFLVRQHANLRAEVSAITCVELYRKGWSIVALFAELYVLGGDGKYRRQLEHDGALKLTVLPGFNIRTVWLWKATRPKLADALRELSVV